ncbi:putative non-repetitive nucleoporin [Talaromyces proteolyticus]|uniref:Non-repetitive nucleoporin n=1 Tax=Talaromyces proteolyticus TaxID=1131652 RepID=A0AAD4KGD4_9EURO|nr:putative non-repetitive nucleoporin [Talaromyces proteolyticus]KAH8691484.1 putative non-repetitive nucleoporin [Talaromyces proteolyticus]
MSYPALTPTRPLPGTYFQTPAPPAVNNGPLFPSRTPSASAARSESSSFLHRLSPAAPSARSETLSTRERAAQTINDTLTHESRYPDLDSYLSQGFSSDYDIPSQPAWAPFHKVKMYNIPDQIFDQYNRAQVSTSMGLFAELNHAWVAIDNALYLWDYTHPNPQLVGYETQASSVNSVKLAKPRAGVFLPSITHVLVISTAAEIILLGMGCEIVAGGAKQVTLYQTGMSTSIRGLDIHVIATSDSTGRIFFAGSSDNDVYEFTYQQEEKWFQGRCGKVNQTSSRFSSFSPSLAFAPKQMEHVEQMVMDDTRNLLYTLSSLSTIRVFHLKPDGTLALAITKPAIDIYSNIGHIIPTNETLHPKVKIVSISPVPTPEASRYHLVATTATGYRIYLSATGSYSWSSAPSGTSPPTSMQAHFVKTPPFDSPSIAGGTSGSMMQFQQPAPGATVAIKSLDPTRMAQRFPPGFFFCFTCKDPSQKEDTLFVSAPDSGRIARAHENVIPPKPSESAIWLSLGSRAEDIGLCGTPLASVASANGFGNELAIQYDQPAAEFAILTNTGVHVVRRRRLVDIFAALVRHGGGDEGLEGDIKSFIRVYGRSETLATALAVACGQGVEISPDSRLSKINDPDVLEYARKVFIEYGGRPSMNENAVADSGAPAIDAIVPSPRHTGIALYMSRLLRSIWKKEIAITKPSKTGPIEVTPSVSISKLQSIQKDLSSLQEFFKTNKNFIEGLSGPEALARAATKQEEIALQAEHRALHSLVQLLSDTIEGISFVLVLFDERVDEIVVALPEEARQRFLKLTFEELFSTGKGYEIAKELVKAIVNRNIAKGSNVETVADALRRRCGNFCSAEDVIIFKAQELLKRATETGANSELGRNLLNESLRLFSQVAEDLPMDYLVSAVNHYIENQFFAAGAIQLCLAVAGSSDKANLALNWIMDGRSLEDSRHNYFAFRKQCYDLIFKVVVAVDTSAASDPGVIDGQYTPVAKRRNEAYGVISDSDDEVFLTSLYDWYLDQGWNDRLLATKSPFVVTYLERKSVDDLYHADLLWRYYGQSERYFDAARVQYQLAQSAFTLPLSRRIEYLGQARANASTFTPDIGRQSRQKLLQEIGTLMDVANIQDDLLQRLKEDTRLSENKSEVLHDIDGPIIDLTLLFNRYADAGGYCDICLQIYYVADHRNTADIRSTWENLLDQVHNATVEKGDAAPYEAVIEKVRSLGSRLRMSEIVFPISVVLPMIERYSFNYQRDIGPPTWVVDLFLDLEVPHETIYTTLEGMFYNDEAPFTGTNKRYIANDLLYIIQRWYSETVRLGGTVFGNDVMAARISEMLILVQQSGIPAEYVQLAQELRVQIENSIR